LVSLFDELSSECLVLLEDVDSAGLVVRDSQMRNKDRMGQTVLSDGSDISSSSVTSRISLSGLLNVIDGVASHEGRVLIMTTNHLEALDSALLRPGRVDLRIHFELAARKQAEDIFLQIFTDLSDQELEKTNNMVVDDNLGELARTFAAEIAEQTLSPAEIQGFLMDWKTSPADAIAKVKEWVEETMVTRKRN
jgi:mitochondrial chaperone BCS1